MPSSSLTVRALPRLSRRGFVQGSVLLGSALGAPALAAETTDDALKRAASKALANLSAWATREKAHLSACIVDARNGQLLAEADAQKPLNPASNQKLLTMIAALDRLGPEHRFSTSLHGRPSADATLSELVLRGDGDPELSLTDLQGLVRGLRAQGITRIAGDVYVDQSAFDDEWDPPAYAQRPNDWAPYRAPVSAVAIEGNTVTLHVLAAAKAGPARVWFTPDGLVNAQGEIQTVETPGKQDIRFGLRARGTDLEASLGGVISSGRAELTFLKRIAAPELAAGRALLRLLAEQGIQVSGALKRGGVGIDAERVTHRSRQLAELLFALGKHSDNFVAEMLLKALGRTGSTSGSSSAGAAYLSQLLARFGALEPDTQIQNGSGLFDANRLSAATLARVLAAAYRDPRYGPELIGALAIGGVDGTLRTRFESLAKERSLRAKTGTLVQVTALSGYVLRAPPAVPLAFSVLVNGAAGKVSEARRKIDEAILTVARA